MVKDIIRNNFWGKYLISCLHIAECKIIPKLIDDETAIKNKFREKAGYDLNLSNPQTFSEKLNWYKLNDKNPLMVKCADKVAVRDYIEDKGYPELLNKLYAVYDNTKQIDISKLPDKFVMKASHGSHMNLVVEDKAKVNWFKQKLLMSTWLKQDIAWSGREWPYKEMPKKIIAEKFLEDELGEIRDYKFFCFNGIPEYLEYDIGRYQGIHYRNYYDMNMNFVPVSDDCPNNQKITLPFGKDVFDRMKSIAKDLAEPFQFVRVDFYYVDKKIIFGELTFFDGGGFQFFKQKDFDYEFSKNWKLIIKDKNLN